MINPADLYELDSQQLLSIRAGRTVLQKQRVRDIVRIWNRPNGKAMVLVLGLEIQAAIHYALPVRILMYDALSYADQVDSASNSGAAHITTGKNGLKLKLTSGEFLSGFKKSDKLYPVITVTIYLGEEPWDAPLSIHEMLDDDEDLRKVVKDYSAYLIDPHEIKESSFKNFSTEIGDVLRVLKYRDRQYKEQVAAYIAANPDKIVNARVGELLLACGIQFAAEVKEKIKKGEDIPMCASIAELIRDGESRGEQKAKEMVEQTTVQNLINLMKNTGWKLPMAMDNLAIPKNMRSKYGKLVKAALAAQASVATVS